MTTIIVKLIIEGIHRWAKCPIDKVDYLRNYHRHLFFITCEKVVTHNDRDVEIICFKDEITQYIKKKYGTPAMFNELSCEAIAEELLGQFNLISCKVLEDNENGARVTK